MQNILDGLRLPTNQIKRTSGGMAQANMRSFPGGLTNVSDMFGFNQS